MPECSSSFWNSLKDYHKERMGLILVINDCPLYLKHWLIYVQNNIIRLFIAYFLIQGNFYQIICITATEKYIQFWNKM